MTRVPEFVVLLATYNGAEYVRSQIDSILCQTGVNVRIIARDDGSRDGTQDILRSYAEKSGARLTIIEDGCGATGSPTGNFLKLIEWHRPEAGSFVAFADQDDVWFPDKLIRAAHLLERDSAGGYSCDLLAYGADQAVCSIIQKGGRPTAFDHLFQGASAGCTYVFTGDAFGKIKQVVMEAGTIRPAVASHDWLLYAATRALGLTWTHEHVASLMYRQHSKNAYGAKAGYAGFVARVRMVRARWYRAHIIWLSSVAVSEPEKAVLHRVSRLNLADRVWLAFHARELRRRPKDQFLLAAAILLGAF